jgi:hypothetical protein
MEVFTAECMLLFIHLPNSIDRVTRNKCKNIYTHTHTYQNKKLY